MLTSWFHGFESVLEVSSCEMMWCGMFRLIKPRCCKGGLLSRMEEGGNAYRNLVREFIGNLIAVKSG